jgi:hypothetical protein
MRHLFGITVLVLGLAGATPAQNYNGSGSCHNCHDSFYHSWLLSGHHNSLTVDSGAAPTFPFQFQSGTPNVPSPPYAFGSQLTWDDLSYVIGGYYRQANFTDENGYLLTGQSGDTTQWNVWTRQWAAYHGGEQLSFDCARCHATGYSPDGHQSGLAGVTGTWHEEGVGCEACHGPGS